MFKYSKSKLKFSVVIFGFIVLPAIICKMLGCYLCHNLNYSAKLQYIYIYIYIYIFIYTLQQIGAINGQMLNLQHLIFCPS